MKTDEVIDIEDYAIDEACHEVFPGIFIGDIISGFNPDVWKKFNITAVLNVSDCVVYDSGDLVEHVHVSMDDGPDNNTEDMVWAVEALAKLRKRHDNVLVHCFAGLSRSASVVASYMVKYDRDFLLSHCESLRGIRPKSLTTCRDGKYFDVFPNPIAERYDPSLVADPIFLLITSAFKAMSHKRPHVYCNPSLWEPLFHRVKDYISDRYMSGDEAIRL